MTLEMGGGSTGFGGRCSSSSGSEVQLRAGGVQGIGGGEDDVSVLYQNLYNLKCKKVGSQN